MLFKSIFAIFISFTIYGLNPSYAAKADPFAALERRIAGRIGLSAVEIGTNREITHSGDERFAMCSTFKLLLAAQTLNRIENGQDKLDHNISYRAEDLLSYSPITAKNIARKGMKISELCSAAIQYSDNTAANLLLRIQGGPEGLTNYLQSIGDKITHLDRYEPFLNTPVKGKNLDSTTANAMASTLRKLIFGDALTPSSREQLKNWLLGNTTGGNRLKAGLPSNWKIADKTGTGENGATNDIGILYPPNGSPIVIAAFISDSKKPQKELELALADIAKTFSEEFLVPKK